MTLILTVRNQDALQEGVAGEQRFDTELAVLGRSRNCDWHLPDAGNVVSSRHCEVRREGDAWLVKDVSTNGTFLNGAAERLGEEHKLAEGDVLKIGPYELVASFAAPDEKTAFTPAPAPPEPPQPAPAPQTAPSPQPAEADPVPDNVTVMWDSLADINKVDWARGGFGADDAAPLVTDLATVDGLVQQLIEAAQLGDTTVERSPALIAKAGTLLKRLVSGLLVMVEARARAKAQMGAEMTGLQLDGNNPIKFARTPEQALAQLLNPPEAGFMEAGKAVEDAYFDLQSHQVATLKAIPGALRATLDRFSPGAVRRRADNLGFLAKFLPAFRDAALWRNYESQYVEVKRESDEAFFEVFAREFRKAYERQLRDGIK